MPLEGRFCWPAQDRVRANPLFAAPRISPVFTASDLFPSRLVSVGPLTAPSSSIPSSSPRLTRGAAGRRGGSRQERGCCGVVECPGRVPRYREIRRSSVRRKPVHAMTNGDLNPRQNGPAPGLLPQRMTWSPGAIIEFTSTSLDWRIVGEQDAVGDACGP